MKRNIQALLAVFLLSANMGVSYAQGTGSPSVFTEKDITQTGLKNMKGLFANGNAIVIEAGENGKTKITATESNEVKEIDGSQYVIFGGKYEEDCETTQITMKGGSVNTIVGGGFGTSKDRSADVSGTTTIAIEGGTITNILIGGGAYYATSKKAAITISDVTMGNTAWILGCMESGNATGPATKYPEFSDATCKLEEMTLDITGGTFGYIALTGGNGYYAYTRKGTATITGTAKKPVVFKGGLFGCGSNGRGDEAKATLEYCDFTEPYGYFEIASVNRGKLKTVDFTFKNCNFTNDTGKMYAYLGGTYLWGDGYKSSEVGIPESVKYTFESSCTNIPTAYISDGLTKASITVSGAKGKIDSIKKNKTESITDFSIGAGKTWTFSEGLEIMEDVTLTNHGTLSTNNKTFVVKGTYIVSETDQLTAALSSIADGGTISLANATYQPAHPIVIDKAITLKSADIQNKATIQGCVAVQAEGVTISNLAFAYNWKSAAFADKTGIAVFGNSATIKDNTFTTTEESHGTNGIVFYPQTTDAANYLVEGNTFSLSTGASTAIVIRENFKSTTQIPGKKTTAVLPNGSAVDAAIVQGKNVFTGISGLNYCRLTGDYSALDGTGSGSEAITQKYLYTYVKASGANADNLKDAFVHSKAFSKIQFEGIAAELLTAVKSFSSKGELTPGVAVICSDQTVYTDNETALINGGQYIKYDSDYTLEIPAKKEATATRITTDPAAGEIEVGQLLSASILTGGVVKPETEEVEVDGTFAWKEPNTTVNGTGEYDVIFTPADTISYQSATAKVSVTAKQYYTVKIGKSENGTVAITGEKPSGRYIKDTTLAIVATPDEHYKFEKWEYAGGRTEASTNLTVDKDYTLTATFVPKAYAVTIGEKVSVKNGETSVHNSDNIAYGTVLSVVADPGENDVLQSLTCNGKPVTDGKVTVTGALDIEATFGTKAPSTYQVKAGEMNHGKILLFDTNGNPIEYGSAHPEKTEIKMLVVPDYGYELDRTDNDSLTVSSASFTPGSKTFTVGTAAVTVAAKFKLKQFAVTNNTPNATVTLDNSNSPVDFGTAIKIKSASASAGYKLLAVVVNGKEVAAGGSFSVEADTKINAVVQELPEVTFTDTEQTYTYNGQAQSFLIRTTPAGIGGITLKYKLKDSSSEAVETAPTDAGEYEVYASMDATDNYKALDKKIIGTLTIKKALYTKGIIPDQGVVSESSGSDAENNYYWVSSEDEGHDFRNAYFKLEAGLAKNYENPVFNIPAVDASRLTKAKLDESGWSLRSTKANEVTLSLSATGGSVSLWNGATQVTKATPLYVGQTLTLKGLPAAGKSQTPVWSGHGVTGKGKEATLVIPGGGTTVTAMFADKKTVTVADKEYTSNYNGTVFGTAGAPAIASDVTTGWSLSFKQGDMLVTEPTEAGEYMIYASRPADENYAAVTDAKAGKLVIGKVKATVSEAIGSDITTAQVLNESVISGVANVDGTFEWIGGGEKLAAGIHENLSVKFTPTDKNYDPVVFTTAKVTVAAPAGDVIVRTLTLKVEGEEHGEAVVMALNGEPVEAGAKVKSGDKLKVALNPHAGYKGSATINGASYTAGREYVVGNEGDVDVVVSYTKKSDPVNPPVNPPSTVVNVESVSLDKTVLTLSCRESYTLTATVNPADADNRKVTWKSSDDKIATVDANGKVTAVAAGKATITVTTEDGHKTATCEVTVDWATGIEELMAHSRVYGSNGQVVIEPLTPVQVLVVNLTGQVIYSGKISETSYFAAPTGVYIVKLKSGSNTSVQKVNVR